MKVGCASTDAPAEATAGAAALSTAAAAADRGAATAAADSGARIALGTEAGDGGIDNLAADAVVSAGGALTHTHGRHFLHLPPTHARAHTHTPRARERERELERERESVLRPH